ncbi:MAG: hypothetical protein V1750_07600, partial [Acidobacteriota bacterium]
VLRPRTEQISVSLQVNAAAALVVDAGNWGGIARAEVLFAPAMGGAPDTVAVLATAGLLYRFGW